jgi:ketol-acid reductoisomerase
MGKILEEIRSGGFAREWSEQQAQARALFDVARGARDSLPITRWEQRARRAFRIGDAGEEG